MPKGKARLNLDRLYQAAAKAEKALPAAVDALVKRIADPNTKAKDLAVCVARLAAIADIRPRMEDDLGLRERRDTGTHNPLLLILGQNVTVAQFKSLPTEERQRLLLAAMAGNKAPPVQSLPTVVNTTP